MKDMSNYEQAVSSLANVFPEAAAALNKKREAEAEFNLWMADRIVTPEFADAAVNFCRANNIDPSAADPLAGYREQVAESVIATCRGRVFRSEEGRRFVKEAIMAAPAPKETK